MLYKAMKSLIAAAVMYSGTSFAAETVRIRADPWCPFTCAPAAKDPGEGYIIDFAKKALGDKGISVDYRTMPWTDAITAVRKGDFEAVAGASKSDAPDFIYTDLPLGHMANCFYVRPDSTWAYDRSFKSLLTSKLAVIADYSYGEPVDSYVKKNANVSSQVQIMKGENALKANYESLLAGKSDIIIEERNVMKNFLRSIRKTKSLKEVACIKEDTIYIGFSPANPKSKAYAKILNEALDKMKQDGSYLKILWNYGIDEK